MSRVIKSESVTLEHDKTFTVKVRESSENTAANTEEAQLQAARSDADARKNKILREASNEAALITENARKKAETMLVEAREESERLKRETLAESRKTGYEEGVSDGRDEGERLSAEARKLLADARATRKQLVDEFEPQMVALVTDIAKKLVGDAAAIKPGVILHLIKAGLDGATASDEISIKVSPDDYETVQEKKDELLKFVGGGVRLEIIRDLSLNKSDCIIETAYGFIDSSLGQQMESLKEDIYYMLEHRNEPANGNGNSDGNDD